VTTSNFAWAQNQTGVTRHYFDANYGRPKAIEYPSHLRVQNIYTRYGEVRDVVDADTGARFWAIDAEDLWGNTTKQRYGNGIVGEYSTSNSTGQSLARQWRRSNDPPGTAPLDRISYAYDSFGNLLSQARNTPGEPSPDVSEVYVYDKLQRLLTATPTAPRSPVNYSYDAVGNIRSKSDYSIVNPNAYSYAAVAGNLCGPNVPKTVQRIDMEVRNSCDANGNIVATVEHRPNGTDVNRSVHYDASNRPAYIARGVASAKFTYAPDGSRVSEQLISGGQTRVLTHGPAGYEREASVNGLPNLRHELGDVVVNMAQQPLGQALTYSVSYRTLDRLGSPLGVLNSAGNFDTGPGTPKTTLSFDAFGQARNRDFSVRDTVPVPGETQLPMTHLGFTGHEHLKDLGLIHMNGRAYDYQLGRFMSVDPFVQFPENSQSLNPYSYIMNNPLSGTDPSGFAAKPCEPTKKGESCTVTITDDRSRSPERVTYTKRKDGSVRAQSSRGGSAEVITSNGALGFGVTTVGGGSVGDNVAATLLDLKQAPRICSVYDIGPYEVSEDTPDTDLGVMSPDRYYPWEMEGGTREEPGLGKPLDTAMTIYLTGGAASLSTRVVGKAVVANLGFAGRWLSGLFGRAGSQSGNFSRELTASDLGIKGALQELRGTYAVKNGVATMRVDMIRGQIRNPLQIVKNMSETAKASGATSLRIEGSLANDELYYVLQRRYGLTSSGATDSFTIPLR